MYSCVSEIAVQTINHNFLAQVKKFTGKTYQYFQRDSFLYYNTACGLHVNILSTEKHLYVPTFGLDIENRKRKQSLQRDMKIMSKIARYTNKTVLPVHIPFPICRLGGNARCLTWQTKGAMADDLVVAARTNSCCQRLKLN